MVTKRNFSRGKAITFAIAAPEAKDVFLAGDFNNWDYSSTRLSRSKDKSWKTELVLRPGRYEYKFVVDGNWISDPSNTNSSLNSFGTENSVIEI